MKNKLFNLIARVTAVATILSTFAMTAPVKGANLEYASATASRLKISELSDWDIRFWSPSGIANGSDLTIEFDTTANDTFSYSVTPAATLKRATNPGTDCANATYGTTLNATATQVSDVTDIVRFEVGAAVATNYCLQVLIGSEANGGDPTYTWNNPSAAATYEIGIVLEGTDSGQIAVPIVDDDQVTVTANVDPAMTFDLDTSIATGVETAAPYTVNFGTLDPTDSTVNVSGETDVDTAGTDVNYIHIDLETNATHGAVVTIQNANGTNGMVSTSDGTDNIANSTGTMADDTENYGFCIGGLYEGAGSAAMTAAAGDWASATTCTNGAAAVLNDTVALSSTAANLLTVAGPVADGEAYLIGSADASVLTEAHDDYVDTLTFIATATF